MFQQVTINHWARINNRIINLTDISLVEPRDEGCAITFKNTGQSLLVHAPIEDVWAEMQLLNNKPKEPKPWVSY